MNKKEIARFDEYGAFELDTEHLDSIFGGTPGQRIVDLVRSKVEGDHNVICKPLPNGICLDGLCGKDVACRG